MNANLGSGDLLAGRYRLLDELGRGGMGVVWRATDEVLGRDVAVKEVKAPAGLEEDQVRQLYARLEQEGRAAARVDHPNVITVYDVVPAGAEDADGRPWIVMELVRGLSLADVLEAEGPMAPARAADVGGKVLAALRTGHAAGVLHRDVKPGNVLIANDGRVVLTDFGIAVIEGSSAITRTGELVGSPEFLAPERALGRSPGAASDLWSLGVTLYAAVEGRSPFRRTTALTTLQAVVDEELPPSQRAGALAPVIEGLLRKDPETRLDGEQAQRMLDDVAAGGGAHASAAGSFGPPPTVRVDTPRPGTGAPVGSSTPAGPVPVPVPVPVTARTGGQTPVTVIGHRSEGGPSGPGGGYPGGGAAGGGVNRGGEPRRRIGRARILLVAAIVVLALTGGSIAVAALNNGNGKGQAASDDGSRAASAGSTAGSGKSPDGSASESAEEGQDEGAGEDEGADGGKKQQATTGGDGTTGNSGGGHTPQPVHVTVHAEAVRDHYSGPCPPSAHDAPYFRATIQVSGTPAQVKYRWVTGGGGGSGWQVLDFAAGDPKSKTVEYTQAPHSSVTDWVAVDVSSPQAVQSNHVQFTVECDAPGTEGGTDTEGTAEGGGDTEGTTGGGYAGGAAGGPSTEGEYATES